MLLQTELVHDIIAISNGTPIGSSTRFMPSPIEQRIAQAVLALLPSEEVTERDVVATEDTPNG